MGLCIKFCSNDNISNTFQSLKLISKVIDLLDNQSLTIRTVSDWLTLWLQVFLGYSGWAPLLQTTWNRKSGCSETKKGNFDSFINFSVKVRSDLPWWIKITNTSNTVTHGNPQDTIYSCASLTGWGGVVNSTSTGGAVVWGWIQNHINYLEILACFLTLKAFCSDVQNCHVKAMIDKNNWHIIYE